MWGKIFTRLSHGSRALSWEGRNEDETRVSFGYGAVRGAKVLEVVPEEAQAVRRVFELAEGYPDMALRKIAAQVTTEGYRGRNGKEDIREGGIL